MRMRTLCAIMFVSACMCVCSVCDRMPVGEFESLSRIRFLGKKSRALAVESLTLSAHTETHTDTLAKAVWLQRISDAFQFQRPQSHLLALTSRDLAWLQGMPRTWRPQPQAGHHGAGVVAHTMECGRWRLRRPYAGRVAHRRLPVRWWWWVCWRWRMHRRSEGRVAHRRLLPVRWRWWAVAPTADSAPAPAPVR